MRARIAFVGLTVIGGALPFACSEFDPGPAAVNDASTEVTTEAADIDTGTERDSGAGDDASDAAVDAGPRTVKCGPETCTLPDEVCCVFHGTLPTPARFCALGQCPAKAPNDAGYARSTTITCDDPTDCETPGNVCCAASVAACSMSELTVIECRAPAGCALCERDAAVRVGRELCRASLATDCTEGRSCSGTFGDNAQWSDYRFCK